MPRPHVSSRIVAVLTIALGATFTGVVSAQTPDKYPSRPIRIVVPFAAGGTTDVLARAVAAKMAESLGQAVVTDNRPGAGGNIGAESVAKAAPDGYTLLMGTPGPLAINASLYKSMTYAPEKDFAPIGQMIAIQSVLVTNNASTFKTLRDVLDAAKASPGKLSYASPGNGTTPHLVGELLKSMTGVDIAHVPYKGDAPAATDLMGGHVPLMTANIAGVAALLKDGKLRALAVAGPTRSKLLPEVPTIAESGVPGYAVTAWAGLAAPAGTPAAIIARLNAELNKALAAPEIVERMTLLSAEIVTGTPDQFGALMRSENVRWAKVIRDANIKLD
jgi:tripartite-type tricarboxylate transporter receptor subunit TctC